jgi:hypothetical protein
MDLLSFSIIINLLTYNFGLLTALAARVS